jgi:predicted CopG family antitoxin
MAKTIAVSDEVYRLLERAKLNDESFSEVIKRLLKRQQISDVPKVFEEDEWARVERAFRRQKELDLARTKEML